MDLFRQLTAAIKSYPRKVGEFSQVFINVRRNDRIYYQILSDGYNRSFVSYRDIASNTESTICANELEKEIIETIIKTL